MKAEQEMGIKLAEEAAVQHVLVRLGAHLSPGLLCAGTLTPSQAEMATQGLQILGTQS